MSTIESSASAYDRLASLTNAMNHAERIAHDWLKVSRAIRDLMSDLALSEPSDSELLAQLATMKQYTASERNNAADAATAIGKKAIELNERIQNGVYNGSNS